MLLIRHLLRLVRHLVGFARSGGAWSVAVVILVGGALVLLAGGLSAAGSFLIYPFL